MSNTRAQIISSIKYRGVLFRKIAKEDQERRARASLRAFTNTGSTKIQRTTAGTNAQASSAVLGPRATTEQIDESIQCAIEEEECANSSTAIDNIASVSTKVSPVTGSRDVYPIREVRQRAWNKLFGLLFPWQFLDERRYQSEIDRPLRDDEVGDPSLQGYRIYFPCAELPNAQMLELDSELVDIMLDRTPDELLDPDTFRKRNATRSVLLAESCCVGLLVPLNARVTEDDTFWNYRYVYYFKGKYHPLPDSMLQWLVVEPVRRSLQAARFLPETDDADDAPLPTEEYRLSITSARGHTRCIPLFPPCCSQQTIRTNICRVHTLTFVQQEYEVVKEQMAIKAMQAAAAAAEAAKAAEEARISKLSKMTSFSVRSTTVAPAAQEPERSANSAGTKRKKPRDPKQRLLVDMPYVRKAENVTSVRNGITFQAERSTRDRSPTKKNTKSGKRKKATSQTGRSIAAYFLDQEAHHDPTFDKRRIPGRSSSDESCGSDRYDSADSFINDGSEPDIDQSLITSSDDDGGFGAPALVDVCAERETVHDRRRAKELDRPCTSVADLVYDVMSQPRFTVLQSASESEPEGSVPCAVEFTSTLPQQEATFSPLVVPKRDVVPKRASPKSPTPRVSSGSFSELIVTSSSSDEASQPAKGDTMLASAAVSVDTETRRPCDAGVIMVTGSDSSDGASVKIVSRTVNSKASVKAAAGPKRPKIKPRRPRARNAPVAVSTTPPSKPANLKIDSFFNPEKKSNVRRPESECSGPQQPLCSIVEPIESDLPRGDNAPIALPLPLVSVIINEESHTMSSAATTTPPTSTPSKPKAPRPKAPKAKPSKAKSPKPRPPKSKPASTNGESAPAAAEASAQVGKKRPRDPDQPNLKPNQRAVEVAAPPAKRSRASTELSAEDLTESLTKEFFHAYSDEPTDGDDGAAELLASFRGATLAKRSHWMADLMTCIGLGTNIPVDGSYRVLGETGKQTFLRRVRSAGNMARAIFGPGVFQPKKAGE